jgi:hypothetical protein
VVAKSQCSNGIDFSHAPAIFHVQCVWRPWAEIAWPPTEGPKSPSIWSHLVLLVLLSPPLASDLDDGRLGLRDVVGRRPMAGKLCVGSLRTWSWHRSSHGIPRPHLYGFGIMHPSRFATQLAECHRLLQLPSSLGTCRSNRHHPFILLPVIAEQDSLAAETLSTRRGHPLLCSTAAAFDTWPPSLRRPPLFLGAARA